MAARTYRRQACTASGIALRIRNAGLHAVHDPRDSRRIDFPLPVVLSTVIAGICSGARSLRRLELRSQAVRRELLRPLQLSLDERIADNTLGRIVSGVHHADLRACLRAQVAAEWERRNLRPVEATAGLSVVAIDGKVLSTVHRRDLHDLARQCMKQAGDKRGLDPDWVPTPEELKAILKPRFPSLQLVEPKDGPIYGLVRLHRATLVSSDAAVCIDQRPIEATTNEMGAMPAMLDELFGAWKHTRMLQVIAADAGNTSVEIAGRIVEHGADYLLRVKTTQHELFDEAERLLARRTDAQANASFSEQQQGATVITQVWVAPLPHGWLQWTHARQLVRVERTRFVDGCSPEVGCRWFVTSLPATRVKAEALREIIRRYWRCENEGHWTSDAIMQEDARRQRGARYPQGMLNFSYLFMIAQNILAVLRVRSRLGEGPRFRLPAWSDAMDYALMACFGPMLCPEGFNDEDEDAAFAA